MLCHPERVSELDEVRAEVSVLREEVAALRAETADTRVLAALADRDAATVRAGLHGIVQAQNALRETQVEQGRALREIAGAVGALVEGQHRLEERQNRFEERQNRFEERQDQFAQRQDRFAEGQQRHEALLNEILRRLPPSQAAAPETATH